MADRTGRRECGKTAITLPNVARELGISVETLDDYPYQLHPNVSADGLVHNWRVEWDDTAPPSADAHRIAGSLSSDIAIPPNQDDD